MNEIDATGMLAEMAVSVGRDGVPDAALDAARRGVADCLAVAVAGAAEPVSRMVAAQIEEAREAPAAQVLGTSVRASALSAAFANGVCAHALDFDDCSLPLNGHPTAPLLPPLLAVAETGDLSGGELLEAYVAGFEVENRLARAVNPSLSSRGWHTTSVLGAFGAAAGAGRLLGLDRNRMTAAFGAVLSMTSGSKQNFGFMTKALHCGMAARNGLMAAQLARRGLTATSRALEGEHGFFRLFCDPDGCRPERMARRAEDPLEIADPGIMIKPYPCCGSTHAAIDALRGLMDAHGFAARDVDRVEAGVSALAHADLAYPDPRDPLEARFSMPFCLATLLTAGTVNLSHFTTEWLARPDIRELSGRVRAHIHPDLARPEDGREEFSTVAVILKSGARHERTVLKAERKGTVRNPVTWNELAAKYRSCVAPALGEERAGASLAMIRRLEEVRSIRELIALLA